MMSPYFGPLRQQNINITTKMLFRNGRCSLLTQVTKYSKVKSYIFCRKKYMLRIKNTFLLFLLHTISSTGIKAFWITQWSAIHNVNLQNYTTISHLVKICMTRFYNTIIYLYVNFPVTSLIIVTSLNLKNMHKAVGKQRKSKPFEDLIQNVSLRS